MSLPPPATTEERILVEAAQRDPGRFIDLYDLHFDRIYAYIARRVVNRDEAEELTAEVFHLALAHLANFEWRGVPFAVWLYRIASNAIIDRAQARRREAGPASLDRLTDDSMREAESRAAVFQMLRELPEDQRRVLESRFVEGRSTRETAEDMGRSEGAVKQLQFRAIESLRARIGGRP